jgi:cytosine/adenosine deaminase-related metal-dependent hydrolase
VSLSPYTELRIGFGFPRTGELLAGGVTVGLSVDTTVLSGNADMFAIMKAIQNVENSRTESEFKLPPRRVLELATIEGARSMGVDDRVGSLKPGKRADVIMVSTRDVNIGVFTDPAHLLVEAALPSNVVNQASAALAAASAATGGDRRSHAPQSRGGTVRGDDLPRMLAYFEREQSPRRTEATG